MGPYNQYTQQTTAYNASARQPGGSSGVVGGYTQNGSGAGHKNNGKSSGSTSSTSSSSSYDYKRYPAGSNAQKVGATAVGATAYGASAVSGGVPGYYEQQQYSVGGGAGYGGYTGYGESHYGSEGGYDNSGDMYLRRRQGRIRRQAIRLPDQPGAVRQVRHRMPTPEPDILERVYIRRQPGDIVEEIIEEPMTPPPRVQERTVVEPSGPPQVVRKVIRVPPRGLGYQHQQQDTLNQYGSLSGANAPAAGSGAFGAGYGQSGQGYGGGGSYYNSSSALGTQQGGPQGYGLTGYERYQGPQPQTAGAQFGYSASNAQGIASGGMYPPQPGLPQTIFQQPGMPQPGLP
ncbi:unnamed protein product, partial [Rotaria sp. Silwood1]